MYTDFWVTSFGFFHKPSSDLFFIIKTLLDGLDKVKGLIAR
jgi:hypothetical protein